MALDGSLFNRDGLSFTEAINGFFGADEKASLRNYRRCIDSFHEIVSGDYTPVRFVGQDKQRSLLASKKHL